MPELPEVETTVRALRAHLEGMRLEDVAVHRADLRSPLPPQFAARLRARRWLTVHRRAKYIVITLEGGESLLLHLGMSGRLLLAPEPAGPHEHLTFHFADGRILRFVDPRRFGLVDLWPTACLDSHPRLCHLGLEPLAPEFSAEALQSRLAARRTAIKTALMDQRLVVGLGNIYAAEALFAARLSPFVPAAALTPGQVARLVKAVRQVLNAAIAAGGASLRDYVAADGQLGHFQNQFAVYDREGEPCGRCRTPVRRVLQAGRATFFCPRCQH